MFNKLNHNNKNFLVDFFELQKQTNLSKYLPIVDLAHLNILKKAQVIPNKVYLKLKNYFNKEIAKKNEYSNFSSGDIYENRIKNLKNIGKYYQFIHAGRSRRDVINTCLSLASREKLILLISELINLVEALIYVSKKNYNVVFPDFTYNQKSQPNFLSHFFLSYAFPIIRTLEGLFLNLEKILLYPGSIGAVNGSSFNIDRKLAAKILKYNGILENTRDAMWPIDIYFETSSNLSSLMIIIDRILSDLLHFNSYNNRYISFSLEKSRASVIMPHKKNPYSLAMMKASTKEIFGYTSLVGISNLTQSGQIEARTHVYDLPNKISLSIEIIRSLKEVITDMKIDKNKMYEDSNDFRILSTEIVDALVKEFRISNRDSYNFVKKILIKKKNEEKKIDIKEFKKSLIRKFNINNKKIDLIIDNMSAKKILSERKGLGTANIKDISKSIKKALTKSKKMTKKITKIKLKNFLKYEF